MPQLKFPTRAARDKAKAGGFSARQGFAKDASRVGHTASAATPRTPDCAIWHRLIAEPWDNPHDSHPLSARLRQATGWGHPYTERVLQEYQRFLYLAVRRRGRVCPSSAVDEAWHTHLLDTPRYFGDFCLRVLGTSLHHLPNRGSQSDNDHQRNYRATLRAYRWAFGEAPPADIWPPPAQRFAERWQQVNQRTHWVLPRPTTALRSAVQSVRTATQRLSVRALRPWAIALTLPAVLMLGCAQGRLSIQPHLNGPGFLSQYFWTLVGLMALGSWLASRGRPASVHPVNARQLDPVEYAYLAGGAVRAVSTGLARLLQRDWISLQSSHASADWRGTQRPWRANQPEAGSASAAAGLTELERHAWQHIRDRGTPDTLLAAQQTALDGLHARLYGRGLVSSPARDQRQRSAAELAYAAAWALVLLWGVLRLVYGWQHGHAISLLAVLLVVGLVLGSVMHSRLPNRLTREGIAAVRQATRDLRAFRPLTLSNPLMPLGLALLGPGALGDELAPLREQLAALQPRDSGGSGCGTSSCGGDSGGGGSDGGCGGGGD